MIPEFFCFLKKNITGGNCSGFFWYELEEWPGKIRVMEGNGTKLQTSSNQGKKVKLQTSLTPSSLCFSVFVAKTNSGRTQMTKIIAGCQWRSYKLRLTKVLHPIWFSHS